jgi:hypothetical protein
MTTQTVIGLDPGGSTGYAVYQVEKILNAFPGSVNKTKYVYEKWYTGTLGPEDHHNELYTLLELYHTQEYHIVCESFEFRQRDKDAKRTNIVLMSREYIGIVKLFGQQRSGKPNGPTIVFQTAAQGKGFVADEKLKAMGLWLPSRKHEMDARRHLIYYMVNHLGRKDLIESWRKLV